MKSKKKIFAAYVVTTVLLFGLFLIAVNTGSLKVSPSQLFRGLFVEYDKTVATIYDLRFPRIFIAMLGGAAMAVSGVLFQAVMKNPLADPGIIGISSGASLVAVIITAFYPQLFFVTPFFAFLGGGFACFLVFWLSWKGGLNPLRLILVGVAINAMFTGLMDCFNSATGSTYSGAASIVNANITMKTWDDFKTLVCYAIVGLVLSTCVSKRCDLLSLEDKTVRSLGVNVNGSRLFISFAACLLASISTAVIGPISFLGLIVPHIARLLVGSGHRVLIPYTMILGAFTFLLADTVGRTIAQPYEISASVIMAMVGAPFFIILLRRSVKKMGSVFEIEKLNFSYGDNHVIRDLSVNISEGKITTLIGANGCGKSTLFNLMTKNLRIASGTIKLGGEDIHTIKLRDFAKRVAIVHQYNTAPDDISVEKLVGYGRTPHRGFGMPGNSEEDEQKIQLAMEITNTLKFKDKAVSQLSGGQKQRVWIAMALAQDTKILFLDEPTTYLDIRYQLEILRLVKTLKNEYNITVVMVLHDINQSLYYSDEIIAMKDGAIIAQGEPEQVISEDLIKSVYGVDLRLTEVDGKPFVLPV